MHDHHTLQFSTNSSFPRDCLMVLYALIFVFQSREIWDYFTTIVIYFVFDWVFHLPIQWTSPNGRFLLAASAAYRFSRDGVQRQPHMRCECCSPSSPVRPVACCRVVVMCCLLYRRNRSESKGVCYIGLRSSLLLCVLWSACVFWVSAPRCQQGWALFPTSAPSSYTLLHLSPSSPTWHGAWKRYASPKAVLRQKM